MKLTTPKAKSACRRRWNMNRHSFVFVNLYMPSFRKSQIFSRPSAIYLFIYACVYNPLSCVCFTICRKGKKYVEYAHKRKIDYMQGFYLWLKAFMQRKVVTHFSLRNFKCLTVYGMNISHII